MPLFAYVEGGAMAKRADAVHSSDVPLYSTGDMTSALGISRATLLYYESHGAVAPNKDEKTGYRSYTNDDVQRLMCGVMLKNLGMRTADLTEWLSGDPFTAERFAVYSESVRRRISYCQAQLECLERLQRMHDATGTLWVEEIEPFYICYDASELGYEDYPDTGALDLLLRNMPIGSVGAQFDGDLFDIGLRPRWGRTVAVRHADLIPGLPEGLDVMGGCLCLCAAKFEREILVPNNDETTVRWKMRDYLESHGLRVAGRAFCPYALPSGEGVRYLLCLPVDRPEGGGPS